MSSNLAEAMSAVEQRPPTSDVIISVQNVSKAYRIWKTPSARLTSVALGALSKWIPGSLGERLKRKSDRMWRDFWAVRDVSFTMRKGESIGIIGRNGSGKSTLLQLVTGTLQPTSGSVFVKGRVAALLELGSGFNPEFTGRENVFLNGAVLGLSRSEIEARFTSIAEFAEIGEYMDEPVKTYSSGMMVRLAFAVAFSIEPELLIVDEALSVGDIFFQQKCFVRVHQMLERGVGLLLVSHDTTAVQNLCSSALLLVGGQEKFHGPPEEAVSRYFAFSQPKASALPATGAAPPSIRREDGWDSILRAGNIASEARSEHGAKDIFIERLVILNGKLEPTRSFKVGETMHLVVQLRAAKAVYEPSTGIHLFDRMNNLVFAAGTRQIGVRLGSFAADESRIVEFRLELSVHPGEYTFSSGCSEASEEGPNHGYIQHRLEGMGPISVVPAPGENGVWPFYGQARLPMEIEVHG
jgi:ABC-type polysaccharide/polyol phosphate transport system ATPase subunit